MTVTLLQDDLWILNNAANSVPQHRRAEFTREVTRRLVRVARYPSTAQVDAVVSAVLHDFDVMPGTQRASRKLDGGGISKPFRDEGNKPQGFSKMQP
jgi:hypothetical protein